MSEFEISIASKDIKDVLARAAGAASLKSTTPILACCLLEATDGKLTVRTTDSFCSESSHAEAAVKSPGSLCVSARALSDIAKNLPAGEVKLKASGVGLELKCGKVRFKLPSMLAEDFPPMPDTSKAVSVLSMASNELLRLISQAGYCMSTDDTRPHLAGMLLETVNDTVTAVATDGHRLALATAQAPHGHATKLLIPAKGIAELKKLAASAEKVTLHRSGDTLLLTTEDTTVTVTTANEQFPPYAKVIPQNVTHRVTLSRDMLTDAVRRVSLVSIKGSPLRLEFARGLLSVSAESAEAGEAHETIDVDSEAELVLGVSGQYLSQALAAMTSDDVALELLGALDPIVIVGVGDDAAKGVLMPMRIS